MNKFVVVLLVALCVVGCALAQRRGRGSGRGKGRGNPQGQGDGNRQRGPPGGGNRPRGPPGGGDRPRGPQGERFDWQVTIDSETTFPVTGIMNEEKNVTTIITKGDRTQQDPKVSSAVAVVNTTSQLMVIRTRAAKSVCFLEQTEHTQESLENSFKALNETTISVTSVVTMNGTESVSREEAKGLRQENPILRRLCSGRRLVKPVKIADPVAATTPTPVPQEDETTRTASFLAFNVQYNVILPVAKRRGGQGNRRPGQRRGGQGPRGQGPRGQGRRRGN